MNESWPWASMWNQLKVNVGWSFIVLKLSETNFMGINANEWKLEMKEKGI